MRTNKIRAAVLMPVYNAASFLKEAIDSVLRQSFRDFEFLIIEDGSTDGSLDIIKSYSDPRIRIIENKKNLGLVESLNKGLNLLACEYIIRMDADDVCMPGRFKKQIGFMDANPDVGVCGSWIEVFSGKNKNLRPAPTRHEEIFPAMLFNSMIYHPSSILRRSSLNSAGGFYDKSACPAEDYDYWVRLGAEGVRFANIPEALLRYRLHGNNSGQDYLSLQHGQTEKVRLKLLGFLSLIPDGEEFLVHNMISDEIPADEYFLEKASLWLNRISEFNQKKKLFCQTALENELARAWLKLCYVSRPMPSAVLTLTRPAKIPGGINITLSNIINFFVLGLLRNSSGNLLSRRLLRIYYASGPLMRGRARGGF